jgi:hypothetical protein
MWAPKLLITCQETLINKTDTVESLKSLSTGFKINSHQKGVDNKEAVFFGKFILCSNNEESFILASEVSTRFWVIKVPVIQKEQRRNNLLDEMVEEIPAFLNFLLKRKLSTENISRMWFDEELIRTDAFRKLAEYNIPKVAKLIKEKISQYFIDFEEQELRVTAALIRDIMLNSKDTAQYITKVCEDYLKAVHLTDKHGNILVRRCVYRTKIWDGEHSDTNKYERQGQILLFKRENFLSDAEFKQIHNITEEMTDNVDIDNNLPF